MKVQIELTPRDRRKLTLLALLSLLACAVILGNLIASSQAQIPDGTPATTMVYVAGAAPASVVPPNLNTPNIKNVTNATVAPDSAAAFEASAPIYGPQGNQSDTTTTPATAAATTTTPAASSTSTSTSTSTPAASKTTTTSSDRTSVTAKGTVTQTHTDSVKSGGVTTKTTTTDTTTAKGTVSHKVTHTVTG